MMWRDSRSTVEQLLRFNKTFVMVHGMSVLMELILLFKSDVDRIGHLEMFTLRYPFTFRQLLVYLVVTLLLPCQSYFLICFCCSYTSREEGFTPYLKTQIICLDPPCSAWKLYNSYILFIWLLAI